MIRSSSIVLLTALSVILLSMVASPQSRETYTPPNGFVPDAATAMRIAEAVWIPIYGEAHIAAQKPFKASLKGDVWTVTGKDLPPQSPGGVAEADISKRDGRILRVIHGQ
jgi:hypothetical protein